MFALHLLSPHLTWASWCDSTKSGTAPPSSGSDVRRQLLQLRSSWVAQCCCAPRSSQGSSRRFTEVFHCFTIPFDSALAFTFTLGCLKSRVAVVSLPLLLLLLLLFIISSINITRSKSLLPQQHSTRTAPTSLTPTQPNQQPPPTHHTHHGPLQFLHPLLLQAQVLIQIPLQIPLPLSHPHSRLFLRHRHRHRHCYWHWHCFRLWCQKV
jgi:hypothetical protein